MSNRRLAIFISTAIVLAFAIPILAASCAPPGGLPQGGAQPPVESGQQPMAGTGIETGGATATCQFLGQPAALGPSMYLCDIVRPNRIAQIQCVAIVSTSGSSAIDCSW